MSCWLAFACHSHDRFDVWGLLRSDVRTQPNLITSRRPKCAKFDLLNLFDQLAQSRSWADFTKQADRRCCAPCSACSHSRAPSCASTSCLSFYYQFLRHSFSQLHGLPSPWKSSVFAPHGDVRPVMISCLQPCRPLYFKFLNMKDFS